MALLDDLVDRWLQGRLVGHCLFEKRIRHLQCTPGGKGEELWQERNTALGREKAAQAPSEGAMRHGTSAVWM